MVAALIEPVNEFSLVRSNRSRCSWLETLVVGSSLGQITGGNKRFGKRYTYWCIAVDGDRVTAFRNVDPSCSVRRNDIISKETSRRTDEVTVNA